MQTLLPDKNIKERFIAKGLIYAEIREYLSLEFRDDGFAGCEIKHHSLPIQVILKISKPTAEMVGDSKVRFKQVRSLIAKRMQTSLNNVEFLVEMIKKRGLCPFTQAELIRTKLESGLPLRRAVNGAIRIIKDDGAQGVEIIISGKTKGQRARSMKFNNGLLIHSGQPKDDYMKQGFTNVMLRQGILGIKVKIMLPYDVEGVLGPSKPMPDKIVVFESKE